MDRWRKDMAFHLLYRRARIRGRAADAIVTEEAFELVASRTDVVFLAQALVHLVPKR